MKYRVKSIVEATQWFKNGDHPKDDTRPITVNGETFQSEGKVVRYYRHPDVPGTTVCRGCGNIMHVHGWIDKQNLTVCPGDFIVSERDFYYPVQARVFNNTYEAV